MDLDQLYALGIQLAAHELLDQSIALRDYIDSEYGVISTDYLQNLIDCENLGKDFPKTLPQLVYSPVGVSKDVCQLVAVMPAHIFIELDSVMIKNENIAFLEYQQLHHVKQQFVTKQGRATA